MQHNFIILYVALAMTSVAYGDQTFRHKVSVAHVLEVKGSVNILDPKSKQRPVQLFGTVYENDILVLKKDSQIVLGFRANRQMIRIKGPGKLVAVKTGVGKASTVEVIKVPDQHRVTVTNLLGQLPSITRAGTTTVRGSNSDRSSSTEKPSSNGLTPIHQTTVLSREPTLSWPPVPNAFSYEVAAYDADGATLWSATTEATALECSGKHALQVGTKCTWTVTAALRNGTSLRAYAGKFSLATAQQHAAASQIYAFTAEMDTSYSVLAAIWYIENGFIAEAIETTEPLVKYNQDTGADAGANAGTQGPLVYKILHRLYKLAGRHDDAREMLKRIAQSPPGPAPTLPE